MSPRSDGRTSAARVAGVYLASGVLWILLSDLALAAVVDDPARLSSLQTVKGWLFVAASAALIAWLVGRELRRSLSSESRFEALAGQGIVGTFAARDGRLIHANRRLAEIFGYDEGDLRGVRILDLVDPDEHASLRAVRLQPGEGGDVVRRRLRGVRRDGTPVPVEVHGRLIDWDGAFALAGILVDLSDHARLEDKLRQAGRLETLGEVTGSVAHDFNNFLTGILANLDLALVELAEDPANAQESLRMVQDAATRAASLTGQLLHFSRARAFQHRPLDVNDHLQRLAGFLRSLADGGRSVVLELQDDLPQVLLDPMALDQLVLNLFVNAKQATGEDGTIVLRTRSRVSSAGADVFVEVEDDGVGMEREVLARIVEPFFTTKERGTGLGLATVRGIMDEARGHLTVESEPGVGTTVRLLFPAAPLQGRGDAGPAPRAHAPAPGGDARILVLDGDPAVARVITVALQRRGYRAVQAGDAGEALALVGRGGSAFDLVVADLALSAVRDGSFPRAVTALEPGTRFLFSSTLGAGEERSQEPSPRHRLVKPFSVDELFGAVGRALRSEDASGGRRRGNGA